MNFTSTVPSDSACRASPTESTARATRETVLSTPAKKSPFNPSILAFTEAPPPPPFFMHIPLQQQHLQTPIKKNNFVNVLTTPHQASSVSTNGNQTSGFPSHLSSTSRSNKSATSLPPPPLVFQSTSHVHKKKTEPSTTVHTRSSLPLAAKSSNTLVEPSLTYYTPQTKLAKPLPSAFHSTGLISKKNRPRQQHGSKPAPETPAKKLNFHKWTGLSSVDSLNGRKSALDSISTLRTMEKGRLSPQDSPIKLLRRQNVSSTPLTFSKNEFLSHQNEESLPPLFDDTEALHPNSLNLKFLQEQKSLPTEEFDTKSSPEERQYRTRCFSTPEAKFKSVLFNPQFHPSPSKMSRQNTPTSRNVFETTHFSMHAKALTKTKQFTWSSMHQTHTPYPRFIDFQYLQRLRDPEGPSIESFSDAHIFPDYFESHFQIIEKLGQGSFADAYKVYSKSDDTLYAVKKTKQSYSGHRDRMKKLQEVEMMFLVQGCSRCVQLISAWEQFGHLYLQMELCTGGTLQAYLDDASRLLPIEEFQIWHILAEISLGLRDIHERDIIHLDIKPANIFLQGEKLQIGDFGLATFCPVSDGIEHEGDRTYIAPEILGSNYNKSADIFSLGLIILEICGNFVLPEYGEYWQMLRTGDFSSIRFGSISPPLITLVKSMLHPDSDQRPTIDIILSHPFVSNLLPAEASNDHNLFADTSMSKSSMNEFDSKTRADSATTMNNDDEQSEKHFPVKTDSFLRKACLSTLSEMEIDE